MSKFKEGDKITVYGGQATVESVSIDGVVKYLKDDKPYYINQFNKEIKKSGDKPTTSNGLKTDYYNFTKAQSFDDLVIHFGFTPIEASVLRMVLMIAVIRITGDTETLDYAIRDASDVDSLTEDLGMYFSEGTVMKSLVGIAGQRNIGKPRHNGTDEKRDMNKVYHYTKLISKRIGE